MQKMKSLKVFMLFLLALVSITLNAYVNGDYKTVHSGNWSNPNIWAKYWSGSWHRTNNYPTGYQNIYISENNTVYLDSRNTYIRKTLTIEHNAKLSPSVNVFPIYLNFYGQTLTINGELGDENHQTLALFTGSSNYNEQYIEGDGLALLRRVELSGEVKWKVNSKIEMARLNQGNVKFIDHPASQILIENLWLVQENTICDIQTKCIITNSLNIGAGYNFSTAPTLVLSYHANLILADHDSNGEEVFKIGYECGFANLNFEGNYYNRIKIRAINGGFWDFKYYRPFHYMYNYRNVQLRAQYTTFENMEISGLTISDMVKVVNNRMNYCEFKNPRTLPRRHSYMLNFTVDRFRNLYLYKPNFTSTSNYSYSCRNIFYPENYGNVDVYRATGNCAGENLDYDPYNRVNWGGSKSEGKNNSKDEEVVASNNKLSNYPNPFNPQTTINYQIKNSADVELSVYNTKGELVKTLVKQNQTKGEHSIVWEGKDNKGKKVASGNYIYKLRVNKKIVGINKCTLLK